MTAIPITLKTTHDQYPDLMKKELNEAFRYANQEMASVWAGTFLKDHFLPNARYVFGYQQRTRVWQLRKIKLASEGIAVDGGLLDLVFKGTARKEALGKMPSIRVYPMRATVTVFTPDYINIRPKNPARPNMGKEMLAVSSGQMRILSLRGAQAFDQKARSIRAAKTVTTK